MPSMQVQKGAGLWGANLILFDSLPSTNQWIMDNFGDYVQFDLDDPTRDYNWGPLTGIAARVAVRFHYDRLAHGDRR